MTVSKEDLVMNNQNLVYSIIHTYFPNALNKSDLFQEGIKGLMKAYNLYNPDYNTKFSTYAYSFILGEMRKYVREDKGIKISRELQKLAYKLEKTKLLLFQKMMREPTISELANVLELTEYEVAEIMKIPTIISSLDEPINENGKMVNLYDYVSTEENYDMNDKLALKNELEKLDENERRLLEARYMQDMTQSETAKILGMSQVQVSRNEKKVLIKLRDRLQI